MSQVVNPQVPQEVEPALMHHCRNVYNAMMEQAVDGLHGKTYEGFLTHLFNDLNLSVPYYTQVTKKLKAMDCIRQLRRGGGTSPSQWLLLQEPTTELFESTPTEAMGTSPKARAKGQMEQDFNKRLSTLEEKVDALLEALVESQTDG